MFVLWGALTSKSCDVRGPEPHHCAEKTSFHSSHNCVDVHPLTFVSHPACRTRLLFLRLSRAHTNTQTRNNKKHNRAVNWMMGNNTAFSPMAN